MPLYTYDYLKNMTDEEWRDFVIYIGHPNLTKDDLKPPRTKHWLVLINLAKETRAAQERWSKQKQERLSREQAPAAAPAPPAPTRPIRPTPPAPTRPMTPAERGIARIREDREHRRRPPPENPAARLEQDEQQEALARVEALLEAERRLAAHADPHAEARRPQEQPLQADVSECCVCFEEFRRADLLALVPCGHRCVCENCSRHLTVCPMCRVPIGDTLKVFD
jgi:hypothetical protein